MHVEWPRRAIVQRYLQPAQVAERVLAVDENVVKGAIAHGDPHLEQRLQP